MYTHIRNRISPPSISFSMAKTVRRERLGGWACYIHHVYHTDLLLGLLPKVFPIICLIFCVILCMLLFYGYAFYINVIAYILAKLSAVNSKYSL